MTIWKFVFALHIVSLTQETLANLNPPYTIFLTIFKIYMAFTQCNHNQRMNPVFLKLNYVYITFKIHGNDLNGTPVDVVLEIPHSILRTES